MVSFSCESCNETMVKKKVQQHLNRCHAAVTCIDCSVTFPGTDFKNHNQCITEAEKYQGKLYQPKVKKVVPQKPETTEAKKVQPASPISESSKSKKDSKPVKEKADSKKAKDTAAPNIVKVGKDTSFKKILKKLGKDNALDKKQVLERLVLTKEGTLVLK